jgi:hypothetical protein
MFIIYLPPTVLNKPTCFWAIELPWNNLSKVLVTSTALIMLTRTPMNSVKAKLVISELEVMLELPIRYMMIQAIKW